MILQPATYIYIYICWPTLSLSLQVVFKIWALASLQSFSNLTTLVYSGIVYIWTTTLGLRFIECAPRTFLQAHNDTFVVEKLCLDDKKKKKKKVQDSTYHLMDISTCY